MSKQHKLQQTIEDLRAALPDLTGAMIASSDGLSMAESISKGDGTRVAAMTATALGLGKRIADTIDAGELTETTVTGENGRMFVYAAGKKGVLAVMTNGTANVGLINLEARSAAEQIAEIL